MGYLVYSLLHGGVRVARQRSHVARCQGVYVHILINRQKSKSDLGYQGTRMQPCALRGGMGGRRREERCVLESNLFCWCWGLMTIAKDK